jgi:hypothetical protein
MKPRLCKSGVILRDQINAAFPDRDKSSDGWVGDLRHSSRKSDHNPDANGVVFAIDVDRDLSGKAKPDIMPDLVDQIRLYAKSDKLKRFSYLIFDGKIASAKSLWKFKTYTGINKHNHHAHISFTLAGDLHDLPFDIPLIGVK